MSQIDADRILEASTTTGTGPITLSGGIPGYRSLAGVGATDGDTVDLYVEDVFPATGVPTGTWECGTYTWRTGGVIERTSVRASSNGGQSVDWGIGMRRVGAGMLAYMVALVRELPQTYATAVADLQAETAADLQAIAVDRQAVAVDRQAVADDRQAVEQKAGEVVGIAQQVDQDASAAVASRDAIDNRIYPGTYATAPVTRPDTTAIQEGDRYFNSVNSNEFILRAGVWVNLEAAATASAAAAAGSAGAAAASQGVASAQATISTTQAGLAATAKTASEVARDAALAAALIYPNTTAGLAATASGGYFYVPSALVKESLILYLDNAGVAVEQKRYPSVTAVLATDIVAPQAVADDFSHVFADGLGSVAGGVAADGALSFEMARISRVVSPDLGGSDYRQYSRSNSTYVEVVADGLGNVARAITEGGVNLMGAAEIDGLTAGQATIGTLGATDCEVAFGIPGSQNAVRPEVVGVVVYGQSNSVLGSSVNLQAYDTLVFNGGAYWQTSGLSDAAAHASLTAITSALSKPQVEGWTEYLKELLLSEDGLTTSNIAYQVLASVDGQGATAIAGLSQGTTPYNRIITDATYGKALANAAGKTYAMGAWCWLQGESDTAIDQIAAYKEAMRKLVRNLTADIKVATGQAQDPVCISWQVRGAYRQVSLNQVDVADELSNMFIATPEYFLQTAGDDLHLSDAAYTRLGAYLGLVHKRVLVDGVGWQPLRPTGTFRQDKFLLVRFNMPAGGALVLDTTTVSLATNYGFNLYDAAGAAITISSVALVGPDTVKITATAAIAAGGRVEYAMSSTTAVGTEFTYRGNLRDNAATLDSKRVYSAGGANYPLHNWSLNFSKDF